MRRACDECGRPNRAIVRNDGGHTYCATCYSRCFSRRPCATCGVTTRLHVSKEPRQCSGCRWAGPCARCGREGFELGRRTAYGAVCKPCSTYFREKRLCAQCRVAARRIVRREQNGEQILLCQRCAYSGHRTCYRCHRHRPVAAVEGGRPVCRACMGGALGRCGDCAGPMPAGRRVRCESCYFWSLLRRRAGISAAALGSLAVAEAFLEYAQWLGGHSGPVRGARLISKHLHFFLAMEQHWSEVPTSEQLLAAYGPARLRRSRLVMTFLASRGCGVLSPGDKVAAAEWMRINAAVEAVPAGTPVHGLIASYRDALIARHESGQLKLTSVRLALRAATGLLLASVERPRALPDQKSLEGYLKARPGQRAGVVGFVNHLRRQGGAALVLPKKRIPSVAESAQRVAAELRRHLVGDDRPDCDRSRVLTLALQYFHGLSRNTAQRIAGDLPLSRHGDGTWFVMIRRRRYWLPGEIAARCLRPSEP
jgi:hypothetical protein